MFRITDRDGEEIEIPDLPQKPTLPNPKAEVNKDNFSRDGKKQEEVKSGKKGCN